MRTSNQKKRIPRRKFICKSIVASSGVLAPIILSNCSSSNDPSPTKQPDFKPEGAFGFFEGIASFDPDRDKVILWTRYTPAQNESSNSKLFVDVATDEDFKNLVVSDSLDLNPDSDYCIHTDIQNLKSNTWYYYRFRNELTKAISPIGTTKTLPTEGETDEIKLAVVSCANYELGYFNVYDIIANSDVDMIIHLGDYIYEGYRENHLTGREHHPSKELLSLEDYRARYRQYRQDTQLQLAHQKKPFICIWDDHEFTNNTYKNGAVGHQNSDGDFDIRIKDALQTWHEYLPCRVPDHTEIYRSFKIGEIANLLMLDTRLIGRDKQLSYSDYFQDNMINEDFDKDWKDTNRSLLGKKQKTWLIDEIQSSTTKWQVIGNQVLMGKHYLPAELIPLMQNNNFSSLSNEEISKYYKLLTELLEIKNRIDQNDPSLTDEEKSRFEHQLPYNMDSWDGYPTEREELFTAFSSKKIISLAGASHNGWHNNLTDDRKKNVGVEFATASIISTGLEGLFGDNPLNNSVLEEVIPILIDDVNYSKISKRGFIKVAFTNHSARAEWIYVDTIKEINSNNYTDFTVEVF